MADQLQMRRGPTSDNEDFVGALAELTVDTTTDTLIVHDGTTPGGNPVLMASTFSTFKSSLAAAVTASTDLATLKQAILGALNDQE